MASQNYARGVPMGNNQMPFQGNGTPPAIKAIKSTGTENGTASSMFGLTQDTTAIEIATGGVPAAFKWVTAANAGASVAATSVIAVAGATANYDHIIPANTYRRFVVPIEVNNPQGYSSMVGANIENGLFRWIAWKSLGIGSVFSSEYGSSNSY